jgi:hypothetical protein
MPGNDTHEPANSKPFTQAPPLYAAMFVGGQRFKFRIESSVSRTNERGRAVTEKARPSYRSCVVEEVTPLPNANQSHLVCDDTSLLVPAVSANPGGIYLATALGLWKLDEPPSSLAALDPKSMLIASAPSPFREERSGKAAGLEEGEGESREVVHRKDGSWCATYASWGGDGSSSRYCFADGRGLIDGAYTWDGGSSMEAKFTLVK